MLVGDPLGLHGDVAGGAAEAGGVHVGDAAIAGNADDHKVDEGRNDDEVERMAKHGLIEVDVRIDGRQLALGEQLAALDRDADGNQDEAEDEEGREEEEENQADVGVR